MPTIPDTPEQVARDLIAEREVYDGNYERLFANRDNESEAAAAWTLGYLAGLTKAIEKIEAYVERQEEQRHPKRDSWFTIWRMARRPR